MGRFVVGDIVAVPFPFSDLSGSKLRPALVLADAGRGDLILCQLTSRSYASTTAVALSDADFISGSLPVKSYIRPEKLFTAEATIIRRHKAKLKQPTLRKVLVSVRKLFDD